MMKPGDSDPSGPSRPLDSSFRKNLVRVIAVQVVALILLGYLQYLFTP